MDPINWIRCAVLTTTSTPSVPGRPTLLLAATLVCSVALATDPGAAVAGSCPTGNLVLKSKVRSEGLVRGVIALANDGKWAPPGTKWNSSAFVAALGANGALIFELESAVEMRGFALQADANDTYLVQVSADGTGYETVWTAPNVVDDVGHGLRTRAVALDRAVTGRFLRVAPRHGDGAFSVSELNVVCDVPDEWPPAEANPPWWAWSQLDRKKVLTLQGILAALGTLLLLLWGWQRRRKIEHRFKLPRDIALGVLGALSLAAWWNFGHFHFGSYIHEWEHFHYHIGAKYAPEMRYTRLYQCVAVADTEAGLGQRVRVRKIRRLDSDNKLGSTAEIMADPTICTQHFTDERWEEFKADVKVFRDRCTAGRWARINEDHGFNATPVWAVVGRALTESVDLQWKTTIFGEEADALTLLGLIDTALLLTMWGLVWWAFGWRVMCVALLYWGCNYPAWYDWNGGAFLRKDWIFLLIAGICFLKKQRHMTAGFMIMYATLLRMFPGAVIAALALPALVRMWRERRFVLTKPQQRLLIGAGICMAILLPLSGLPFGGFGAWGEFVHNSRKHLKTPATNHIGLEIVVAFDPDTRVKEMFDARLPDPFSKWKDTRLATYKQRRWLHLLLIGAFIFLLGRASLREPDWVTAAMGVGLITIASQLAGYYYGFLLAFGLLWERRPWAAGLAVAAASLSCWLPKVNAYHDQVFTVLSAVFVCIAFVAVAFPWKPAEEPAG